MRNLDIHTTGNSIGETLVLLKEQIEFVYGDLSRRTNLSADQKTMMRMLHTYIAPQSATSRPGYGDIAIQCVIQLRLDRLRSR